MKIRRVEETYLHDGEIGVWGLGWDLDYSCTSCSNDRCDFTSNHSSWEVPSIDQLHTPQMGEMTYGTRREQTPIGCLITIFLVPATELGTTWP